MRHRHLVHQEFTAAAIEDILDRGKMPDWEPLIAAIEADPYCEVERLSSATARCTARQFSAA
jgi:hypothetical protein